MGQQLRAYCNHLIPNSTSMALCLPRGRSVEFLVNACCPPARIHEADGTHARGTLAGSISSITKQGLVAVVSPQGLWA